MDKVYLGRSLSDFYPGIASDPVTRVELLDESGNITGQAGKATGKTLTALQPDGTDKMAQYILSQVSGYTHKGYEGSDALLNPAAELGDGVTVDGYYLPLIQQDTTFDGLLSSGISAPDADEIEDEYPYKSPSEKQVERKISATRSMITKTATEIRLEVTNEVDKLNSSITQTASEIRAEVNDEINDLSSSIDIKLDGITSTVKGQGDRLSKVEQTADGLTSTVQGQGNRLSKVEQTADSLTSTVQGQGSQISKISQTVSSISSEVSGLDGSLSRLEQTVDSFTLEVNNGYSSSRISLLANGVEIASERIRFTGDVVFESDLSDGNTVISGDCIQTGEISAEFIRLGGQMNVYTSLRSDADSGGYLGYMTGMTAAGSSTSGIGICDDTERALMICTNGGARMGYNDTATVVCTRDKVTLTADQVVVDGTLKSSDGTVITSDRRAKEDIQYQDDLEKYLDLFDRLKPVSYRLKDRTRRHMGLIAQDVESSMQAAGIASEDFGGLCIDTEGQYGLRYEEFIPILIAKVQKLENELNGLEGI